MPNNYKAWWTLLFIQCTMVALVLGSYFGMKTNIQTMKSEMRLMTLRVKVLEQKLSGYSPTGGHPEQADSNSRTALAPPQGQQPEGAARSTAPPGPTASGGHDSPVCVNKMTHQVFACENASKCLGSNNFDGGYFKGIRSKLSLADAETMMICDEKGVDNAPPRGDNAEPTPPSQ